MKKMLLLSLIAIILLTACTAVDTPSANRPTATPRLGERPGFVYWPPEDWATAPAGLGLCETGEHCKTGPNGAVFAVWMTSLEEGCRGAGSLVECLDEIVPTYAEKFAGYELIARDDYTTYTGLTGQTVEFTFNNGQTHVREMWTHSGPMRIRVRFLAPEAEYEKLDETIETTFLSVRPNRVEQETPYP